MSRSDPERIEARSGVSSHSSSATPGRNRRRGLRTEEAAFVCDTKLRVESWSAEAERMFGWAPPEIHGRVVSDVLGGEILGTTLAEAVLHAGKLRGRAWHLCKDGTRLEVESSWSELYGADGRRTGFVCLVRPLVDEAPPARRAISVFNENGEPKRADEALTSQTVLLETIIQQAADGIAVCDPHGRFTMVNAAARRMAGMGPESGNSSGTLADAVGQWHIELANDREPMAPNEWPLVKALAGETTTGLEANVRRPDGGSGSVRISSAPLRSPSGELLGAVLMVADVSAEKKAQESLRAQSHLLELVLESVPVAAIVLDRDSHVVHFNPVARRILGGRPELPPMDRWPQRFGVYLPDMVTLYPADQLPTARALRGEKVDDPEIFLRGEMFPEGIWLSATARPLVEESGEIHGAVLLFQDITEQKRAEQRVQASNADLERRVHERTAALESATRNLEHEVAQRTSKERALRRSEAALSTLIESSTDAIWSVDRSYRIRTFNAVVNERTKAVFGRGMVIGAAFHEGLPERGRIYWQGLYDRVLAGESISFEESQAINGAKRDFLVSLNPVLDQGEITGVTVFAKDISELKQAEERSRQREQELAHVLRVRTIGELAAGLAHEINQPLGAIANYAQGCRRRLEGGAAADESILRAVEAIAAEALRAGEVIRRLRDLIRRQEIRRERIELNRAVQEAVRVVSPQAARSSVTIRCKLAAESPSVHADSVQVEQVVLNLLLNAIEAIGSQSVEPREIVVESFMRSGDQVEVTVCDSGEGLAQSPAEDIFNPFVSTKCDGLGMGLAISHSIIEAHGGRIWATSNAVRGATVHFTLPIEA